jgi:hypothetical protein
MKDQDDENKDGYGRFDELEPRALQDCRLM